MLQGLAVVSDAKIVVEFIPTLPLPRSEREQFIAAEKNARHIADWLMYSAFAAILGNDFLAAFPNDCGRVTKTIDYVLLIAPCAPTRKNTTRMQNERLCKLAQGGAKCAKHNA